MNKTLGLLALVGFVLSVIVHLASIGDVDLQSVFPAVWALHVGIFVVFVPMVLLYTQAPTKERANFWGEFPAWTYAVGGLLVLYVVLNFLWFMSFSVEGMPVQKGNLYVLDRKGAIVRELSEAEFHARRALELRGFSGHWLLFYGAPLAHFLLRRKTDQETPNVQS